MEDIVLKNYNKVHTVEQNWYSVGSIKLPAPVNPMIAGSFILIAGTILLINRIVNIPLPEIVKFAIIPYLITRNIKESKKDGKNLLKYYISYIPFKLKEKVEYERFKQVDKIEEVKFFY
jgi:hypothetical protein